MKDIFHQTNIIVMNNINKGAFVLDSIESQINNSGIPMRLAPGLTVKEYINDLYEEGVLEFNNIKKTFSLSNPSKENNYDLFKLPETM